MNCGSSPSCNCDWFAAIFDSVYIDDSSDSNCILPSGTIECASGSACDIDCSDEKCWENIIDGTQATSLTVDCGWNDRYGFAQCGDTVIYTTIGTSTTTDITCTGGESRSEPGCEDTIIIGISGYDLSITANPFGLYGGYIYAQNIQNSFTLTCIGDGTGSSSWDNNYACFGRPDIYIPALDADLDKLSFNCYGSGCFTMNFVKEDGFDNITEANLNFNGCGQCDAGMFCNIFLYF